MPLGVAVGAPVLTLATRKLPRKTVLLALMAIFTLGNLACALAPNYGWLMAARVVTSLAHGTFFGVGSVVATGLVAPERRASAIAIMFTGLTAATMLGVPAGAWLGLHHGWRSAFWAVDVDRRAGLHRARRVRAPRAGARRPAQLRDELAVLGRPQVLLGLAMTVVGFAGVFVVFTYIQPLLNRLTGLPDARCRPSCWCSAAALPSATCSAAGWPTARRCRRALARWRAGRGAGHDAIHHRPRRSPPWCSSPAGRRLVRDRGAAAAAGAGEGLGRRPEPGVEPEHRGLQPRQRASAPGSAA
jgi:MFS family permease